MRDLSHVVVGGDELALVVVPVGAATVRVRRLDLEDAPRIARLVVDEAIQRGVHDRVGVRHEADVGAVDDLELRVELAEAAAQFDLKRVALDDRPPAADVLRLLTASLLQPQFVGRLVGVEAEDGAHIRPAHALGAEGEPRLMAALLRGARPAEAPEREHVGASAGLVDGHAAHS